MQNMIGAPWFFRTSNKSKYNLEHHSTKAPLLPEQDILLDMVGVQNTASSLHAVESSSSAYPTQETWVLKRTNDILSRQSRNDCCEKRWFRR